MTNLKNVLTEVTNGTSTTENTSFDATGRITGHKQTTDGVQYTTGYTYYLSGAVNEMTYPSGRVAKTVFDTFDGSLSQIQSKRSGETFRNYANGFVYTAAGAVQSVRLGNGLWENALFNERLQPTQIGLGNGVNSQSKLKIQYGFGTTDNNGNVLSQTITVPGIAHSFNQTYTYDALNRLSTAEETYNVTTKWEQEFSYDRYGNRIFVEANTSTLPKNCVDGQSNPIVCTADVPIVNPQITSNNKLTGTTYDASGNVTMDGKNWSSTYDGENRQVLAQDHNDTEVGVYSYDGDGRRVKKYNPDTGETTIFVYNAAGTLIAEYDTTVQIGSNAKTIYTTNDGLGSPRINTDAVGAVIARHDYHPFGEEITTATTAERTSGVGYTSDTIRKKFAGYERDTETGLDFAQARYLQSGHGRFQSPDPVIRSLSRLNNPQLWNAYVYAGNSPLRFSDPNGLERIQLGERDEEQLERDILRLEQDLEKAKGWLKEAKKQKRSGKEIAALKKHVSNVEFLLKRDRVILEGTKFVNAMLGELNSTNQNPNKLVLKDFALTTDYKNDFPTITDQATKDKMAGAQAFVLSGGMNQHFYRGINIRTDTGFYKEMKNAGGTGGDYLYYGASALRHEDYHWRNQGPNVPHRLAFAEQKGVLSTFRSKYRDKTLFDQHMKEMDDAIADKKNQ